MATARRTLRRRRCCPWNRGGEAPCCRSRVFGGKPGVGSAEPEPEGGCGAGPAEGGACSRGGPQLAAPFPCSPGATAPDPPPGPPEAPSLVVPPRKVEGARGGWKRENGGVLAGKVWAPALGGSRAPPCDFKRSLRLLQGGWTGGPKPLF